MAEPEAWVDPSVSRAKFEREVEQYRALEDTYIARGWWLVKACFPEVFVVFGASRPKPPSVPFGVLLDFTDYDLVPPSVRLVNPFTRVPLKTGELNGIVFPRRAPNPAQVTGDAGQQPAETVQPLLQSYGPEEIPFLCLPGVREYHSHPGHSGDNWLLHRGRGEGTLYFLLDTIYTYGIRPLASYKVDLQVRIGGYVLSDLPE